MSRPLPHQRPPSGQALAVEEQSAGLLTFDFDTSRAEYGKHGKWVEIPLRRIIYIILALLSICGLSLTAFWSVRGYQAYHRLAFPHHAVHASPATAKDGSLVVKPYFAPLHLGGASDGVLIIRMWFREGVPLEPLPDDDSEIGWAMRSRRYQEEVWSRTIGEQGFLLPEEGEQHQWEEVWTSQMTNLSIEETRYLTNRVTLPGRIVHSLVTNARSTLVATFELLPEKPDIQRGSTFTHTSTRPVGLYGESKPWPLPYPSGKPPTSPSELNAFLAHSSVGQTLHIKVRDWRSPHDSGDTPNEDVHVSFVTTRSVAGLAGDYAVYGLEGFKNAMTALKSHKESCANSTYYWDEEWRYGPFLTTRLSPVGKGDYIKLPAQEKLKAVDAFEVEDFSWDWHVTWSNVSPARLAFTPLRLGPNTWELLENDSWAAKAADEQELKSALLGLAYNPGSRPVARGAIGVLSVGLWYLSIPFIVHYWATRRVTIGLPIYTLIAESIVNLTCYIVTTALDAFGIRVFYFVVAIIGFVAIITSQIYLAIGPDFQFSRVDVPTLQVSVPIPSAVRFRHWSVEEKASFKADARFPWWLRVSSAAVTFCLLRFAPSPGAIIPATAYANLMHGFGGTVHWDQKAMSAIHLFKAFQGSVWLASRLSQILLNYRSKSFGGSHGITAYLLFGSLVLSHVTKFFVRWFGRAQFMQPFTLWDVVTLLISGTVVAQARLLPRVDQKINGALD